jgi:hypothetical protein
MHSPSWPRRARLAGLSLLAACARERRPYWNEILERAELREAWTTTILWFAVVFVLVLALVVVRQRRKPIPMLGELFRARRLPDPAAWKRRRAEVAAARRAQREVERRQHAAQAAALASDPPSPLGPPTLGFGRRFGLCLIPALAATVLFSFHVAAASMPGWGFLGVLLFGGGALLAALASSLFCALIVSLVPWRNVVVASASGASSAALGVMLVPWLADYWTGCVVLGAIAGVIVGIADEASRRPQSDAPGNTAPPEGGAPSIAT